jgi:HAE1 family hydrophobic/amphiphilic exporter-1
VFFAEQGWGGFRLTLEDEKGIDPKAIQEMMRKELPKLARAEIGFQGDNNAAVAAQRGAVLPDRRFHRRAGDAGRRPGAAASRTARNCATCASTPATRIRSAGHGQPRERQGLRLQRHGRRPIYRYRARGAPLREFRRGDTEVPVNVRFAGAEQFRMEDMSNLNLTRPDGTNVPLLSLVDVKIRRGSSQIWRQNRQTGLGIKATVAEKTTAGRRAQGGRGVVGSMQFKPGYSWDWGQSQREDDEAGKQMVINMLIALVMILVVMAAIFESLVFPIAILSSILFSFLGVYWLFFSPAPSSRSWR